METSTRWRKDCRFWAIDLESHRKSEKCRQVPTKTLHENKVDDSLVDEENMFYFSLTFVDSTIESIVQI